MHQLSVVIQMRYISKPKEQRTGFAHKGYQFRIDGPAAPELTSALFRLHGFLELFNNLFFKYNNVVIYFHFLLNPVYKWSTRTRHTKLHNSKCE